MGYCRLCLANHLSQEDLNIITILEKIKAVFSFEITSHPNFSNVICSGCAETVSQFYDFHCMVQQNQLKLYSQVEKNPSEIKEEWQSENYQADNQQENRSEVQEAATNAQAEPDEIDEGEFEEGGEEWFPEDEIKIEPTEINLGEPVEKTDQRYGPWKLENNFVCRRLKMVCDICQADHVTYQNLETHMKHEHQRNIFVSCCDQKLGSKQGISDHFENHNPVIKIKSSSVNKTHQLRSWMFKNSLIYRRLDIICDICNKNQCTYQKLVTHLEKIHNEFCYIICCNKKLTNEKMLSKHLESHQPVVKSKIISEFQNKRNNVFVSVLTDFQKDLKGYEPLPNMDLALQDHTVERRKLNDVVDHLIQLYFTLNCEFCNKKFDRICERRKHFRQNHPKEKYFVACCGIRLNDRFKIMRHLNLHQKRAINETQPVKWSERLTKIMEEFRDDLEQGGFALPDSQSLKMTADLHHMQDFIFAKYLSLKCDLCDADLKTFPERRDHFRDIHPKVRFYITCCSSKIHRREQIMSHLQRHRKYKAVNKPLPYSKYQEQVLKDTAIEGFYKMDCYLCDGYKGKSYQGLRRHMHNDHRKAAFFITCCNKRLYRKCHIYDHIATHQESSFKCEGCEEEFSSDRNLRAHIRKCKLATKKMS